MSDVPEERLTRRERWRKAIDCPDDFAHRRENQCLVLADAEVAAERQRLHDLEARIEAVADEVEDWIGEPDLSWNDAQQGFERILAMLQDIPTDVGDPLAALVSPVSDDTGGTK